ncbi:hypothetical protein [Bacillus sp. COPE52]|uniref:hypothetical protein n=1 Tax=Bacillus sp. COPE52 TaxID=2233998 RepID=UPI000E10CD94|nr:hypothetical protein [Bacillus sp. COPE52]AXK19128.1 hypothetical protein DPQ31_16085 [Bacillus sp. COPE52]
MKNITTFKRYSLYAQKEFTVIQEELIEDILIPVVTEFIIGYTGVDFEAEGRDYPASYEAVAFRLITYHLEGEGADVVSEQMGNYRVQHGVDGIYPTNLLKGLSRRMRTPSARIRGRQPKGRGEYDQD